MSGEYGYQPVNFTYVAAVAVSKYHIVQNSGGKAYGGLATAVSQVLAGVALQGAQANDHFAVCPLGDCKVTAGAAVSLGARITTNGSGRAVAAASGDVVIGFAREAAAADGDIITAYLNVAQDTLPA